MTISYKDGGDKIMRDNLDAMLRGLDLKELDNVMLNLGVAYKEAQDNIIDDNASYDHLFRIIQMTESLNKVGIIIIEKIKMHDVEFYDEAKLHGEKNLTTFITEQFIKPTQKIN